MCGASLLPHHTPYPSAQLPTRAVCRNGEGVAVVNSANHYSHSLRRWPGIDLINVIASVYYPPAPTPGSQYSGRRHWLTPDPDGVALNSCTGVGVDSGWE